MSVLTSSNHSNQTSKILAWNSKGLLSRTHELAQFLSQEGIDVELITETYLTFRAYVEIPHYDLYTCNHLNGASHGGSVIYIRKNMKHRQTSGFCTSQFQAASVAVDPHCSTSINVAAVYSPSKHNIDVNGQRIPELSE